MDKNIIHMDQYIKYISPLSGGKNLAVNLRFTQTTKMKNVDFEIYTDQQWETQVFEINTDHL